MLDTRGIGMLHSVERLLGDVFIPALSKSRNWGQLSEKDGANVRQEFMNQLENFVGEIFLKTGSSGIKGNWPGQDVIYLSIHSKISNTAKFQSWWPNTRGMVDI